MNDLEALAAEYGVTPEQLIAQWQAGRKEYQRLLVESVIAEAESITLPDEVAPPTTAWPVSVHPIGAPRPDPEICVHCGDVITLHIVADQPEPPPGDDYQRVWRHDVTGAEECPE